MPAPSWSAYLIERVVTGSDFDVGIRYREELEGSLIFGLVQPTIWIERDVPYDPTLEYSSTLCKVLMRNNSIIEQFQSRLWALARFSGLKL